MIRCYNAFNCIFPFFLLAVGRSNERALNKFTPRRDCQKERICQQYGETFLECIVPRIRGIPTDVCCKCQIPKSQPHSVNPPKIANRALLWLPPPVYDAYCRRNYTNHFDLSNIRQPVTYSVEGVVKWGSNHNIQRIIDGFQLFCCVCTGE